MSEAAQSKACSKKALFSNLRLTFLPPDRIFLVLLENSLSIQELTCKKLKKFTERKRNYVLPELQNFEKIDTTR